MTIVLGRPTKSSLGRSAVDLRIMDQRSMDRDACRVSDLLRDFQRVPHARTHPHFLGSQDFHDSSTFAGDNLCITK